MDPNDPDWKVVAPAFFALAHGDRKHYDALEPRLKESPIGRKLGRIAETADNALIDEVGRELTHGSPSWYAYLGRTF